MKINKGLLLLGVLGQLSTRLIAAQPPPGAGDPIELLKTAPRFATGGIGFAGTISLQEKALRQVLEQKNSKLVLTKLLDEATLEGQMYALVGLKAVDPAEFKSRLGSYQKRSGQVHTASGCIFSDRPISVVVKSIEAGHHDLPPHKQTSTTP
jgi:hypothetical protein